LTSRHEKIFSIFLWALGRQESLAIDAAEVVGNRSDDRRGNQIVVFP
jgi:hypothetical protein